MKWLNYHHLLYFRMIANEGSIAKAAEKLKLGQPALSAQLKTLEESFGHDLFERRNRRLFLTDAGKVALKYANEIFDRGQELLEVIDDKAFSDKVHLHLGALDSVPKTLITKLVESAHKIKDCYVTVLEGRGDELIREVSSHQIDILISNYPAPTTGESGLYSRSLAKIPVSIFGSPKFKDLKRKFPQSLANQPLILPTKHSKLRQDISHYFTANKIISNVVAETQDTSVQKLLAIDGVGLAPLPDFSVKDYLKRKDLVKIGTLTGVQEEFWMISAPRTIENPVASKLIKEYRLVI